jgi:hypothetical protein
VNAAVMTMSPREARLQIGDKAIPLFSARGLPGRGRAAGADRLAVHDLRRRDGRPARREFAPHFWYLAKKLLRLPREYMFPPGHTSIASQLRPGHAKRKFISLISSWQEVEDGRYAIVGSPATVREMMRAGIKQAGCGIVQGIFPVGSLPHGLAMKNMALFAREVMPALRAEFG